MKNNQPTFISFYTNNGLKIGGERLVESYNKYKILLKLQSSIIYEGVRTIFK